MYLHNCPTPNILSGVTPWTVSLSFWIIQDFLLKKVYLNQCICIFKINYMLRPTREEGGQSLPELPGPQVVLRRMPGSRPRLLSPWNIVAPKLLNKGRVSTSHIREMQTKRYKLWFFIYQTGKGQKATKKTAGERRETGLPSLSLSQRGTISTEALGQYL